MAEKKETKTQRAARLRRENRAKAKAQSTRNSGGKKPPAKKPPAKKPPAAKPPVSNKTSTSGAAARRSRSQQTGTSYRTRREGRAAPPQTKSEQNRRLTSGRGVGNYRTATAGERRRLARSRASAARAQRPAIKAQVQQDSRVRNQKLLQGQKFTAPEVAKQSSPTPPKAKPARVQMHPDVQRAAKFTRKWGGRGLSLLGLNPKGAGGKIGTALTIGSIAYGLYDTLKPKDGPKKDQPKKKDNPKSRATSTEVGPAATPGAYTISKKGRLSAARNRADARKEKEEKKDPPKSNPPKNPPKKDPPKAKPPKKETPKTNPPKAKPPKKKEPTRREKLNAQYDKWRADVKAGRMTAAELKKKALAMHKDYNKKMYERNRK